MPPEGAGAARRAHAALAATLLLWLCALYAFRFQVMEIEPEADPCLFDPPGASCRLRAAIGLCIHLQIFGTVALLLGLGAHLARGATGRALAHLALFAALLALVLYNVRYGAPAAVAAVLALAVPRPSRHARDDTPARGAG
jgi:hypothetical protein